MGLTPAQHVASPARGAGHPPATAAVVRWWRAARGNWFRQDPDFDACFRARFLPLHRDAADGALDHWCETAAGALALLILLDQFPRNAFRGTPRMYATDPRARRYARTLIAAGFDRCIDPSLRLFCYLPFAHSENLADQDLCVRLHRSLGQPWLAHALDHRDIIRRFGRFPHRNAILGRDTTPAEQAFLDGGGFAG